MSTENYVHKITKVIPLGDDWGTVLQKYVLEAADDLARHLKAGGSRADQAAVDLKITVTIHFERAMFATDKPAGDAGAPHCVCVFHPYPEGGGVCICVGPGAADCDCDQPDAGPIVAME